MPSIGRTLLALVGIVTSTGGFIADWNETHIYNPRWPPHAKFHNGQTLSMGLLLGIGTLFYLFRPSSSTSIAVNKERVRFAAFLASLYWITQLSAILYPGSLAMDPEFGTGFPQAWLCGGLLCMVGVGIMLEDRALDVKGRGMRK